MTSDYKSLEIHRFARNAIRETAEVRFWKQFKNPIDSKQIAQVSHIDCCPVAPYNFAVTSSTRVLVYDGQTAELAKTISRFKDVALGGAYRRDGKLIAAGGVDGVVQVFDVNSRLVLRKFRGHRAPVHLCRFSTELYQVITGSDDKTIRLWDIPTDKQVTVLSGHSDYVRCGRELPSNPSLFVSGSYDHTLRMWDLRSNECVLTMDHGAPIQAMLPMAGGNLLASAGDNSVKIWDVLGGGRMASSFSNHQKAITAIALDSSSSRLLTASLDQMVKFHDVTSYQVTHTMKFESPILAMGISPTNKLLAVGMLDGSLSVRRRVVRDKNREAIERSLQRSVRTGTRRYFMRGGSYTPAPEDIQIEAVRRQKRKEYDVYLRKFQYHEALDAALKTRHAVVVVSMLDELVQRGALRIALSGRSEENLVPVLKFVTRHITNPHFADLLHDTALVLLDLYGSVLGRSMIIDELFFRLKREIQAETDFQKELCPLLGTIDMLLANSAGSDGAASADVPDETNEYAELDMDGDVIVGDSAGAVIEGGEYETAMAEEANQTAAQSKQSDRVTSPAMTARAKSPRVVPAQAILSEAEPMQLDDAVTESGVDLAPASSTGSSAHAPKRKRSDTDEKPATAHSVESVPSPKKVANANATQKGHRLQAGSASTPKPARAAPSNSNALKHKSKTPKHG